MWWLNIYIQIIFKQTHIFLNRFHSRIWEISSTVHKKCVSRRFPSPHFFSSQQTVTSQHPVNLSLGIRERITLSISKCAARINNTNCGSVLYPAVTLTIYCTIWIANILHSHNVYVRFWFLVLRFCRCTRL